VPDWMPAFPARSFSAASTCANSPPPPYSSISEPTSPEPTFLAPSDLDERLETPMKQPQCPPGALDKSSWLQARKVFIGGIPQSIDQNGLYQMFSKMGKVKKAWLQLFYNDRAENQIPATKKHRGFGFVIFYEMQAIDQMLGDESSRFISFGPDLKLEVKRAFGKMSVRSQDESPPTRKEKQPLRASPVSQPVPASPSVNNIPASPAPQTYQTPSWVATSVTPATQTCQSGSWAAVQAWQSLPGQQPLVVAFPCVPPFPFVDTRVAQQVEVPASYPTVAQQSQCAFLSGIALHGSMGQKPVDNQALARALLQAMPDHYED